MATMDYTDPRLLKTHGADAVTYSLFLKVAAHPRIHLPLRCSPPQFAIFLLCAMGLVGLVIMMPVNFTADQTGISHEKVEFGLASSPCQLCLSLNRSTLDCSASL